MQGLLILSEHITIAFALAGVRRTLHAAPLAMSPVTRAPLVRAGSRGSRDAPFRSGSTPSSGIVGGLRKDRDDGLTSYLIL